MRTTEILEDASEFITRALRVINTDHSYIHDGIGYKAFIYQATLAEGYYLIKTPANKYIHFKNIKLQAMGGAIRLSVRRSTVTNPIVIDSEGSVISQPELVGPNNLNDTYGEASGTVIKKTPTFITSQEGEDWFVVHVLGDTTNQFVSVSDSKISDNEEVVMEKDSYYSIKLEKIGTDVAINVCLSMFWYEEELGS